MSSLQCRVDLVALDLDGVVWRGQELLLGVREALSEVVARGLDLRYVTNNSTLHREEVSQRLGRYGLPAGPERVITSGSVTAHWLKERLPAGAMVLVVGEEGLLRELREAGLVPVRAGLDALDASGEREESTGGGGSHVQAVVVGMDRSFCYASLAAAQAALLQGEVIFVATNRDNTFPAADGLLPGAGAIVAAVAAAAGREPVVMGKPSPAMAQVLAEVSGVAPERTLFIGDRLTTDIAMGRAAGMLTALVLSGVTSRDELEKVRAKGSETPQAAYLPDHVLGDLGELPGLLDWLGEVGKAAPRSESPRGR